MYLRRWVYFTLCLALVTVLSAAAQQGTSVTGGLNGVVIDSSGAVVSGATIILAGPQGTRTLTTDAEGRYSAAGLTPGLYNVTAEKEGFKKVQSSHNEVVVGISSLLNLTLPVGDVAQTVEVNAAAVSIDTQSTAISANLTDTFYNSIPMARNVTSIFYVAPGVAGGQVAGSANQNGPGSANPSIGGASGLENLYVVDGVTITDQAFGSIGTYNRYHGSLGTGINLTFIKEVDVRTADFPPQYGKATGGIVQIVTKSGSNNYHGAVGAYFGPGSWYANRNQFYQYGYLQTTPSQTLSSPQYDVSAEFGGYIPGLRDKLFFFGAFDPTILQNIDAAAPNAPSAVVSHGPYAYSTTTLSWAGKLSYNLSPQTTMEASSFGDPSRHNDVPNSLSSATPVAATSSYQFGSRDSVFRINSVITPSWLANASFTYNYNHFNETPLQNTYGITDQSLVPQGGSTVTLGFGAFEPSKNDTYSLSFNTSKIFHFFGQHTLLLGYSYDHTNFLDSPSRSGPLFAIPSANAASDSLAALYSNIPAHAIGSLTNATFTLAAANTTNFTDPTCTYCATYHGEQVYASISRGTYVGLNVQAFGRYHAAYLEDSYQMNRFINLDVGVRWEEERVGGDLLNYAFTGSWSPRLGINLDPLGDRKGKIFFNYGRNYWAMPLDAAIRQLGNEQDDTSFYFAPEIGADGSVTIVPDSAHTLNGLPKQTNADGSVTNFGAPSFASSTGEGILPGTKGEYEDEYVLGLERELGHSIVAKARYTDRRLGRVIEDIGSQSPEASTISGNYTGGIYNPGPGTDIAVNEDEVTYTPAQYATAQAASKISGQYVAPVPGCTATNDTSGPKAVGGLFINGADAPVGGACFLNLATMDAGPGDGKPDGFVRPVRRYQAMELELDKRFTNHWLAVVNYRFAKLYGNYEGAYRNDNGQSDPGISSLFDFTAGKLGLLGDQFTPGYLSTDRRNVGNLFLSYTIGQDTRFFNAANRLNLGLGLTGESGVPLSLLADHPIYLNQGEVPLGGRGAAGRTPSAVQLNLHSEYPVTMHDRYTLRFAVDAFNVTNSQFMTGKVQYTEQPGTGVGVAPISNTDYGRPTSFQGPFYARGSIRFEF
ncbi:TonB-dependent receptor [Paracidobacterium acidisoli]|uniref:TonB-dependent receptor n=1 Tax=Paracidobacterium acidisoli TaxID=2303751 RepID=A0A372IK19_9BACT|nr:carboxypeptidase regulatory-like domain-containing protein [Paracidobacterium acidisoli]MBT9332603.1 carboxypeptidase regulatory-like domain-containing protein [Paracidobacterium acidisoli]